MTLTQKLIRWYDANRRDLPWRETRDPYRVWVSEIILQQTRVEQGLGYFHRFLDRFPDIPSLARAPLDEVLKCWQGLGYYSRARNMLGTAQTIMRDYGGKFPSGYDEIRSLKGIGPYTAAAIASICFDRPVPVVDGNVIRFLSRLYGIGLPPGTAKGKARIHELAGGLMDPARPGDFNQALMEFGATCCKPVSPGCPKCIFRTACVAYRTHRVLELPIRRSPPVITHRWFHYLLIRIPGRKAPLILLKKRIGEDIWKGLYEFPLIEKAEQLTTRKLTQSREWKQLFHGTDVRIIHRHPSVKHQLSHQLIHALFYEIEAGKPPAGDYLAVSEKQLKKYPFPRLIERFIDTLS